MDAFSPTTPARVRTLLLPIGRIKKARFYFFLRLLTPVCEIRLGDVTPDPRPDRNMFSPQGFPNGVVLYEFSTAVPPTSHLALSPFEIFREPLVIIGIADAQELEWSPEGSPDAGETEDCRDELLSAISDLREEYPRTLVQKVLLFDSTQARGASPHSDIMPIPSAKEMKATTIRTVMCDLTSLLLAEMTTLAISIKALPSIASPSPSQSTVHGLASSQWYPEDSPALIRTSSQNAESGRSNSPAIKTFHRMSMPAFPSHTSSYEGSPSGTPPATTENGRQTPPAKTFEEIADNETATTANPGSRPASTLMARESSRDRVSVHGFGPGSINERNRRQGQCRVFLVVGSLYLQTGRWHDALREFAEGAVTARSFSDHLWHAKALENLVTSMLLLSWSGADFKIPQVCYPILERSSSSKTLQNTANGIDPVMPNGTSAAAKAALRQELAVLLPDLVNTVLSIYSRGDGGGGITSESIPQLAFSECVIRFTKILTSINLAGGELNQLALESIVRGVQAEIQPSSIMTTRLTITPSRSSIADILLRALPGSNEHSGLSPVDQMMILAGIASVFSALGLQRKKAIMLKEYLAALIQALTQAKKVGAAEAGFHPSTKTGAISGVSLTSQDDAPEGLEDFLNLLCRIYGIPDSKWSQSIGSDILQLEPIEGNNGASKDASPPSHLPEQLVGNFVLRFFGSVNMKSDVLRTCIELCEALPDLHGVLHYTSALLRTAGPGIAPSADTSDVLVTLAREEQVLLANNVSKAVADRALLGISGIEADYWDEFLVRGVYLVGPPTPLTLHPQRRSDLGVAMNAQNAKSQGPFLHNAFLARRETKSADSLLVAGDEREFVVSLQNPYDFEVHIESLRLTSEGLDLASAQNLIVRPYRTQSFSVTGSVNVIGQLSMHGCTVKVRGCRERVFPIFKDPWAPEQDVKVKNIGLLKATSSNSRPLSDSSMSSVDRQIFAQSFPTPASVALRVIPEQPVLMISSVSLPQSAMMLLEGESRKFSVSVRNTSTTVAADFVHLSFRDSTAVAIQEALGNKKLLPADLFELEYQSSHHPAIRAYGNIPKEIAADETAVFEFEILGKPGLTTAVVQIDYANLSKPHLESEDDLFTRHITVPITVTVNASIQLQRLEIMPISTSLSWRQNLAEPSSRNGEDIVNLAGILGNRSESHTDEEYCLLLLDLRNAWPIPLEISLQISKTLKSPEPHTSHGHVSRELVQPGHVSRMVVLLPKVHIPKPHARIRSANERQFVVSAANLSPEAERTAREIFWFREELLSLLHGSWRQDDDARSGSVDLRAMIRLNARMVDTLKLGDVNIELAVLASPDGDKDVKRTGKSSFEIKVDEYLTLFATIRNRSDATIYPILRLRPLLAHQPPDLALELGKRFVWSGLLQQVLAPLGPGATIEANLAICALCSGEFEIGASVEEVKVCKRPQGSAEAGGNVIPDPVASTMGRRTWTASEPCRVRAVED